MRPDELSSSSPIEVIDDSCVPEKVAAHRERIAALKLEHEGALLRMLMGKGASHSDAKDIAQEAYVTLLGLDAAAVSFLEGLLWKIASNLLIDRARAHGYRTGQQKILAAEPEPTAPSPEDALLAQQRMRVVRQALAKLPERDQIAFRLRIYEGMRMEVIAARMDLDLSNVKKKIARAIVKCKRAVALAERDWSGPPK